MKVGGSAALNLVKSSDAYFRATIPENQKNRAIMLKHIFFLADASAVRFIHLFKTALLFGSAIWLSQSKF